MSECTVTIAPDLGGQPIEVDDVLCDTVAILHLKEVELMLHISDRVVWSKGGLEFCDEGDPVVHPARMVSWISRFKEVWFEPL